MTALNSIPCAGSCTASRKTAGLVTVTTLRDASVLTQLQQNAAAGKRW